jgi:hypothetical protein
VDIGVYSDSACTQTATSLNWGSLEPGDQATRTVYVKNNGNTAVSLSVSTTGWSPLNAQQWMTVSWNRQGETLQPNQSIQATITLTVSSSIDSGISNFNFDVTITGTA